MKFSLNEYGYVTNYLVSGCLETPFACDIEDKNQLASEKKMRSIVAERQTVMPKIKVEAGEKSPTGGVWSYNYSYGNWFVDRSTFYPLLTKVEFCSATVLIAPRQMDVEAWLWSFAAVDIWVNDTYVGGIDTPVYKPINRKVLTLPLKEGENLIYIRLQNLGVRDTRSLFGLQIPGEEKKELSVTLPEVDAAEECVKAGEWLSGIRLCDKSLLFDSPAPAGSKLVYDKRPIDFEEYPNRFIKSEIAGKSHVDLEDYVWVTVSVTVGVQTLSRAFVRQELLQPEYTSSCEDNQKRIYERIGTVGQIPRGDGDSFSMYPVLARYYLGNVREEDEGLLLRSLDQIESRRDCSDFLSCAMVRFMKLYPMSDRVGERCRNVMLSYRYWMDEQGADGMCFWSENHSLMFFVSAYIAGDVYPDDVFVRSGKTGREIKEASRVRIYDWVTDVAERGFDEFHSGGYTPITFAAILNVVDFGDEELSGLAVKAADRLLKDLAVQTFKGVSIAPMGRVYGEVLYPFHQDIQCLINLINPEAPDKFSEWIIFLATSKYKLPLEIKELMDTPLSLCYEESNAKICVEKTEDYMLTSVESPRRDGISRAWQNISREDVRGTDVDTGSFQYVKSLNECFHGTTQFEPGVFGYQQHMWYAALDADTAVFVNHPGGSCESCSTRPGYWFGNGIMPALKQDKNKLYAIYQIPETHPIPFTHLYWPGCRFDGFVSEDSWIAGNKGDGFVAVWTSGNFEAYEDQLAGCEYRVNSRNAAYVCICGSKKEYGSLDAFLSECRKLKPEYDPEAGVVSTVEDSLVYQRFENLTQYI